MIIPPAIDRFLFERIPAKSFQWMRIAWAALTLGTFLSQWPDVAWFYSKESFLLITPDIFSLALFPRFSLLHFITDPQLVFALYIVLLLSLFAVLLGIRTRGALILCMLLLHSFHHRNPILMGGGDVLLYNIGFLLMVTSLLEGTSPSKTIPIWPYRLLLWQIILIYLSSLWWKLLGTSWLDGTAITITFLNPDFARFSLPKELIRALSPLFCYLTMIFELLWIFLLIPNFKYHKELKRVLIIAGIFFHLGILLFLKVGSFSLAMLVAYIGLWGCRDAPTRLDH
ncbi:MAG TPA: hypothetical protein VJB60_02305 [Candidatus Peribacterales bacterium]|nr:hypothetical protein [Candidatus Peribacterales bacterium]